jgi:hypothetical protein
VLSSSNGERIIRSCCIRDMRSKLGMRREKEETYFPLYIL